MGGSNARVFTLGIWKIRFSDKWVQSSQLLVSNNDTKQDTNYNIRQKDFVIKFTPKHISAAKFIINSPLFGTIETPYLDLGMKVKYSLTFYMPFGDSLY